MPGITLESAIVAAIIAFFGALLGQITGAFFGARYAADVNRRTQLEIADLSFKRQWRERLVRPFLETANTRMALVSQFTKAVSAGEQQVALDITSEFRNIDTVIHNAGFAALGDAQLTEAADAWEELESRAASTFLNIASGPKLGPEQSQLIVTLLIDLVDATARLQYEAARYASGEDDPKPRSRFRWRFWRPSR